MQRHDSGSARTHHFGFGFAARPQRSGRSSAMLLSLWLALFFSAALTGCDKGPARECDSRFDCPAPFVCDEGSATCVDPPGGDYCTASASCTDPLKPYCYLEVGVCVPCLTQGSNNECPDRRICDGQRTCGFCEQDDECIGDTADENTLCLRTGGCAAQSEVAYVVAGGADNSTCTFAAPCSTLASALATNRPYIRLRGDITVTAPIEITRKVSIFGNKANRVSITNPSNSAIFDIMTAETVELRDLELSDGGGAGIVVASGFSPKLDLDNVDVIGNNGVGISSGTAALVVRRSLIVGNGEGGITANAVVVLENNIIVGNGGPASIFGGLQLSSTDAANVVRFNTFANNNATGAVTGRSVSCGGLNVSLSSNIFADAAPQVNMCSTRYSLFPTGTAVAGTDKAGDPMFVATTPPPSKVDPSRDGFTYYHIQGGPAVDSGEVLETGVAEDFDREPRGKDGKEIGADEIN